ncbi:MAG: hypothetical protein P857_598 [Candidatus Xenolissoclinum pacificiensis L6]|uniref:Uncharacterized protein n=1 Tax=Candidatus Xenolissoclinum pacificiensis L6 TaxID=1401685 RepID=W2V0D1_9RICK|nr:MAG: hypothetical protein P857_598 [Candidatus Xenolissoclinum pacificiensis L6]
MIDQQKKSIQDVYINQNYGSDETPEIKQVITSHSQDLEDDILVYIHTLRLYLIIYHDHILCSHNNDITDRVITDPTLLHWVEQIDEEHLGLLDKFKDMLNENKNKIENDHKLCTKTTNTQYSYSSIQQFIQNEIHSLINKIYQKCPETFSEYLFSPNDNDNNETLKTTKSFSIPHLYALYDTHKYICEYNDTDYPTYLILNDLRKILQNLLKFFTIPSSIYSTENTVISPDKDSQKHPVILINYIQEIKNIHEELTKHNHRDHNKFDNNLQKKLENFRTPPSKNQDIYHEAPDQNLQEPQVSGCSYDISPKQT